MANDDETQEAQASREEEQVTQPDTKAILDGIHIELTELKDGLAAVAVKVLALSMMVDDVPPMPHTLDVPYLSQWDRPDADDRPGDCGPACVAMLARFLTIHEGVTVDEVATACGQPTDGPGKWYTGFQQLVAGAATYGLALEYERPLLVPRLELLIDMSAPVLVLINHEVLNQHMASQDDYTGGHFWLVVGYDDESIIVHDPNHWGDRRAEGAFRRIPRDVYELVAGTPKEGYFSYGWQGLVVE